MTPRGRKASLDGVDPAIAEGLTFLGLTAYEIRVYQAIVENPGSRIPEIARHSSVPQPKVYATVRRLIERGLCESELGPVNQYRALAPDNAFGAILRDSATKQENARLAVQQLHDLHEKANQGLARREGRIKVFQGKPAVTRSFNALLGGCEDEAFIIARLPMVVRDGSKLVRALGERGAKVRVIYEVGEKIDPADRKVIDKEVRSGAEIRTLRDVPTRMAVFDRRITILPMLDPVASGGDAVIMLEIRNEGLSHSFLKFCDILWEQAEPWKATSKA